MRRMRGLKLRRKIEICESISFSALGKYNHGLKNAMDANSRPLGF